MAKQDKRSIKLDGSGTPAPSGESKSQARQRAARLAQDTARTRKRKLLLVQGLVGLVAVAVVVAVTVVVLTKGDNGDATAVDSGSGSSSGAPAEVDADGAFTVGNPDAPVTVQMVEDFQCPICRQFEATNADLLSQYAAGDDVKLQYRGIAFLDQMSSTEYSTRALNASACVMGQGEEVWTKFHREMYEQQPPEQGDGLSDDTIIGIAKDAGADTDAISSCITGTTYADWVKDTTNTAFDDKVTGTPTIFVNGTMLSGLSTAELTAAVDKALGK